MKLKAPIGIISLLIIGIIGYLFFPLSPLEEDIGVIEVQSVVPVTPEYVFGFRKDSIIYLEGKIRKNECLSHILGDMGVPLKQVYNLSNKAKHIFPVQNLRCGKHYTVISIDSCFNPTYFIYKPDIYKFVKFDLRGDGSVEIVRNQVDTVVEEGSGIINGSLWVAMEKQGLPQSLIERMEDALAWSVDFYHIQKGDRFKLIYEQLYIDGEKAGIGKLIAGLFESGEKQFYSIHFKSKKYDGFFDEEGRTMKKAFLKSPVKFGRISSRYNLRRKHPVKKRVIPHLGTDYAAPRGTPILAVANGTITKVSRTRNNGNYVKMRHDKVYETQYLHMSKFAKGIKPGVKVKQGEVIGYVGSTGLATGPHVCFRFWKNGRQVNPLREKLPPPEPMDPLQLPEFYTLRDSIKTQIDEIKYPNEIEEVKEDSLLKSIDSSPIPV